VPYKTLLRAEGGYLEEKELRAVLEGNGICLGPRARFLCYCNGGVASTAVLFGLWQLGVPLAQLSNYDGSWGEWGRGDFPVEVNTAGGDAC
jgi:3-mercaptopyruvate sulfurtransferase SseA